jgi:hypothetical protein
MIMTTSAQPLGVLAADKNPDRLDDRAAFELMRKRARATNGRVADSRGT